MSISKFSLPKKADSVLWTWRSAVAIFFAAYLNTLKAILKSKNPVKKVVCTMQLVFCNLLKVSVINYYRAINDYQRYCNQKKTKEKI